MKEKLIEIMDLIAKYNEEVIVRFKHIEELIDKNILYIQDAKAIINDSLK
ncbi:hypothetical protein DCCM_0454 [Desulfocucumis palustris]|uniref:Uncharacterized protein n=1 Tax=Desulfocucumis palustris TaxID=1898651 RepID=A0A2L2XEK5_9FIRM|nr:hypothetical protein [Desulfocucumis palustris]GBF32261.1 hypothetical protein DCCM_0454 [Desulfocucumis palustris]